MRRRFHYKRTAPPAPSALPRVIRLRLWPAANETGSLRCAAKAAGTITEDFMDKMTDAKIRSWLEKHKPDVLTAYHLYQADSLSEISAVPDTGAARPESLRTWLENHHPDILDEIPLW